MSLIDIIVNIVRIKNNVIKIHFRPFGRTNWIVVLMASAADSGYSG